MFITNHYLYLHSLSIEDIHVPLWNLIYYICLYMGLRFNELIQTTKLTSLGSFYFFNSLHTSSTETLSYDFHFTSHRTTIIQKLMNLLQTTAIRAHMAQMYQYMSQAAWAHSTNFCDLSSLSVLLWVFHIQVVLSFNVAIVRLLQRALNSVCFLHASSENLKCRTKGSPLRDENRLLSLRNTLI